MDDYVGIVCGLCDAFNPMRATQCVQCEAALTSGDSSESELERESERRSAAARAPEAAPGVEEERMDQARNYVCKECSSPVPPQSRFCGVCGAPVPDVVWTQQTDYFGSMQAPGRARLILIRGDQGVEGLTFLLQGDEHVAGRQDAQIVFPEDPWLSPKHANFLYRDGKLIVRDEASANGVYVRVRGAVPLQVGDAFLCGEQVFRLDGPPVDDASPAPDQTYFHSSPKRPSAFRVTHVLVGGDIGMVHSARENSVLIGREEADMNFPLDVFMSGNHARVENTGAGQFQLVDLDSRNGTFVRIRDERVLAHGDYLFLGKQLLRVEMTA